MFEHIFQGPGSGTLATYTGEILVMWLVSGLLGLFMGYLLWYHSHRRFAALKDQVKEMSARLQYLETANKQLWAENTRLEEELTSWKARYETLLAELNDKENSLDQYKKTLATFTAAADDLTVIEGLDMKMESLLHEAGIHTFQDMANTPLELLRGILKTAGSAYGSATPEHWRGQAYRLYQSRKEHYARFAELKIGRKQLELLDATSKMAPYKTSSTTP